MTSNNSIINIYVWENINYYNFLKTKFDKELLIIKDKNKKKEKIIINIYLSWNILVEKYNNYKEDNIEKLVWEYRSNLIKFNLNFNQWIEKLIWAKLYSTHFNFLIYLGNDNYICSSNHCSSSIWKQIIDSTNKMIPKRNINKIIENKVIFSNNQLIYSDLNCPIYIDILKTYNISKFDDYNYNNKILINILDSYNISTLPINIPFLELETNFDKSKLKNNIQIYKKIQEIISYNISPEFDFFIENKKFKRNNIIKWLFFFIEWTLYCNNYDTKWLLFYSNFIKNIKYINTILSMGKHDIDLSKNIKTLSIFVLSIIKQLFTISQLLSIPKNISLNTLKFEYLTYFPFDLNIIKNMLWEKKRNYKVLINLFKYSKKWRNNYIYKSWEYLFLLLEIIEIIKNLKNIEIQYIEFHSWYWEDNYIQI